MQQFINVVLNGIIEGAVIAAFALALVLIFRSTRIINFAQGSQAMFTTLIALTLISNDVPYWIAFVVAIAAGFLLGAILERGVIRPLEGGLELNIVIATLGLYVAIQALAAILFGSEFRSFPSPAGLSGFQIGDLNLILTPTSLYIFGTVAVVVIALTLLFRKTNLGLTMRAAAFDGEVSRLLGVKVSHLLTFGWALAGAVGSVAGILAANGGLVYPAYMEVFIVFGFIAAVIGGLDSPVGAVVGGLLLGLVNSAVSNYGAPGLVNIAAFVLLIAVLLLKPGGLFSSMKERRV
ncbi:branched-chain amino acid transport system permease protein [Mumia flava]|uniref:Branched-chain amino acid transport system permease protein n=1 Tax=Mumia flava TaxID=1348852 RepID=A0A0B2BBI3_9ACTN|nr:branched-chain amino acid ABC transporter permease [Mumia flava]PJJ53806.1 branched-chain amino acid transport system permease protein [Mumia flava]